ncbi:hypothetical protein B566_EDAN009558 [Ephemera danica]|nr:hypothetical protein B566_EDAN009558 [Ephemera danica]
MPFDFIKFTKKMRLTRVLWRQNIGRMFKDHWKLKRRRVPVDMGTEKVLSERGISLVNPLDIIKEPRPKKDEGVEVVGHLPKAVLLDESHPLYHTRHCYEYQEETALIEGVKQAQVLTNTVEVKEGLPDAIKDIINSNKEQQPENLNDLVQSCILNSHLFDAYQEKLPKIKDPLRFGPQGIVIRNAPIQTFLMQDDNLVKLRVVPGALLCGPKPLPPHANAETVRSASETSLPEIFPLSPVVSLPTTHFYDDREIHPVTAACGRVHTAIFHFNETKVVNLHEEQVTEEQILGRSLMHVFTVALAEAKHRYGDKVPGNEPLPEPVTVQGVQLGNQWLHFTVLQLNSLKPTGPRNILWSSPIQQLFSSCEYSKGAPVLKDYNPKVFNTFLAFCSSGHK